MLFVNLGTFAGGTSGVLRGKAYQVKSEMPIRYPNRSVMQVNGKK